MVKKHEIIQTILVRLGGPGSGHHGHAGVPGKRGGSAPSKGGGEGTITESVEFVKRLTLSGGDIGQIDLSDEARAFLAQTITQDSYTLYRGIGLVRGRATPAQIEEVRRKKPGDPVPDYLAKQGNPFASYTTKKSIAKYYASGKVSLITTATVPRSSIIADTRNLERILDKVGMGDLFSASDYAYFKSEGEVLVREPISSIIYSVK